MSEKNQNNIIRPSVEFVAPSNQHQDYQRFYLNKPDPGFSPEKNKYIVDQAIAKHEKRILEKRKAYRETVHERAEAITDYLFWKNANPGRAVTTDIEKYFGKKNLARLRGEKIIQTLQKDGRIILTEV